MKHSLQSKGQCSPHIDVGVAGVNVRDAGWMDARVGADAEVVLLPAGSSG
jgi:hypothetical protein